MRPIRNARLQHARVGATRIDRAIVPVRPYFVTVDEWVASDLDKTAFGLTPGVAYRRTRFPGYPLVVTEDTEFRNCSFDQASPHTDGIFSVAPGVRVRFIGCNLINVKIPDEAEVLGGSSQHAIEVPATAGGKVSTNLLCECLKCCTYWRELNDGMPIVDGHVDHDTVYERVLVRRQSPQRVSTDRDEAALANGRAATRYGVTMSASVLAAIKRGV